MRVERNEKRSLVANRPGHVRCLCTMDQGIPHQQNLSGLAMGIIVLEARSSRLVDLAPLMDQVNYALQAISNGQVVRISA